MVDASPPWWNALVRVAVASQTPDSRLRELLAEPRLAGKQWNAEVRSYSITTLLIVQAPVMVIGLSVLWLGLRAPTPLDLPVVWLACALLLLAPALMSGAFIVWQFRNGPCSLRLVARTLGHASVAAYVAAGLSGVVLEALIH